MKFINKYTHYIDKASEWTGRISCWIIVPLVLGTVYDVFMRYLFEAPTKWAYEMTWMEYGALFMLGGAYGILHKLHVRVDVLFKQYPKRAQLWFDTVVYVLVFLPLFAILIIYSSDFAWEACTILEVSSISYWQPYVWPIKLLMPFVFTLMFLQAISELIKIVIQLKRGGDAL